MRRRSGLRARLLSRFNLGIRVCEMQFDLLLVTRRRKSEKSPIRRVLSN